MVIINRNLLVARVIIRSIVKFFLRYFTKKFENPGFYGA